MISGKAEGLDRSGWEIGPWDDEPDWAHGIADNGLHYAIRRNGLGALSGYVGVPEGHDLFEARLDEWWSRPRSVKLVSIHGGITYSGFDFKLHQSPALPDNLWWLGFDCAHFGDRLPGLRTSSRVYRDFDYVRQGVIRLASALLTPLEALALTHDSNESPTEERS